MPIEQGELMENLRGRSAKDGLAKEIIDKHRAKADLEARTVGGRLVVDTVPEFHIRRGSDLLTGGDFILTASRWTVEVPNSFDPAHAAARSR